MPTLYPGTPEYYIQGAYALGQNAALAARAQQQQASPPSQPQSQGPPPAPHQGYQGYMASPGYNSPENSAGGGQQPCQGGFPPASSGGQACVVSHVVSGVVYYRPA